MRPSRGIGTWLQKAENQPDHLVGRSFSVGDTEGRTSPSHIEGLAVGPRHLLKADAARRDAR